MFINEIYLHDSKNNITVNNIKFGRKNFFVGVSGAGKSTILNGIITLVNIAKGGSSPADTWNIKFTDNTGRLIEWSGRFSKKNEISEDKKLVAELLEEKLVIDEVTVFTKKNKSFKLNDIDFPIIEESKSNFYLLRNHELIKAAHASITSIIYSGSLESKSGSLTSIPIITASYEDEVKKLLSTERNSIKNLPSLGRMVDSKQRIIFSCKYDRDTFDDFMFIYTSVFPSVREISVKQVRNIANTSSSTDNKGYVIQLKMDDGTLVEQGAISSGMFKTMTILADIIMSSDDSVILMDEIENSLGINCLQEVLNELILSDKQIIITTHHPKIINKAPIKSWKIVSRSGGVITAHEADSIKSTGNHHDPFFQLINSDIYKNGNQK
ncbi:AAA family ATPase [Serratia fonticola]|uniref:AAA family ATPase n=1 Tax=Serratia fonticola TaxID=47917 RepID=UPI003AAA903D